jgi:hypothetical protein
MPRQLVLRLLQHYATADHPTARARAELFMRQPYLRLQVMQVMQAVRFLREEGLVANAGAANGIGTGLVLTHAGRQVLAAMRHDSAGHQTSIWEWDGRDFDYPCTLSAAFELG